MEKMIIFEKLGLIQIVVRWIALVHVNKYVPQKQLQKKKESIQNAVMGVAVVYLDVL